MDDLFSPSEPEEQAQPAQESHQRQSREAAQIITPEAVAVSSHAPATAAMTARLRRSRGEHDVRPDYLDLSQLFVREPTKRHLFIGSGMFFTLDELEAAADGEPISLDERKMVKPDYRRNGTSAIVTLICSLLLPPSLEDAGAYFLLVDIAYSSHGEIRDLDDRSIARRLGCNPRTWRKVQRTLIDAELLWRVDMRDSRS
jgi:hypothetical protein